MMNDKDDESLFNVVHLPSEIEKSTWMGKFIYMWQWRFYFRNYNHQIKLKDIPKRRKVDDANRIYKEFEKLWSDEISNAKLNNRKPNLFWPIMKQYGILCFLLSIVSIGAQASILTQALYVGDLIRNTNKLKEDETNYMEAKTNLIYTSVLMILFEILFANLSNLFTYNYYVIGMKVRISLSCLIYRKSLRLSKSALGQTSTGQIVNFLSNDLNSVYYFFNNVSYPIVAIFMICYSVFKLWDYLQWYTISGVVLIICVLPIQSIICKIYSRIRLRGTEYTDERLILLNEFLSSIDLIKYYCWELEWVKKINDIRKREVSKIRKSLYLYSFNMGLFYSVNKVVIYVILVLFSLGGGLLTDEAVFSCLAVLNTATYIICIYVPLFFLYTANFWISIKRISNFLNLEERIDLLIAHPTTENNNNNHFKENFEDKLYRKIKEYTLEEEIELKDQSTEFEEIENIYDISIKNLVACYSLNEDNVDNLLLPDSDFKLNIKSNGQANGCEKRIVNVLKNINFNCKQGELLIVVGPVGSGKTSLFQAILSELRIREGNIQVNGKLSYASQEPWTFAGSVRENILFDSEFDQEKYDEVVKVCALERDLTLFPDGDLTFIGERGVALSGGQKARINLARSLYFDADIYLLDDPLSAVDSHVAKHLFKKAINDFLKQKTVILVTHQLNFIKQADKVLFIKDGKQILFDNAKTIMKKLKDEPDSEFAKFLGNNELEKSVMLSKMRKDSTRSIPPMYSSSVSIPHSLLSRRSSLASLTGTTSAHIVDELIEMSKVKDSDKNERKMQEEEDKLFLIAKAYGTYFKNRYSIYFGPLLFIAFVSYKLMATSCDYFLKLWTESIKHQIDFKNEFNSTNPSRLNITNERHSFVDDFNQLDSIKFYSALIGLVSLFSLFRSMLLFMYTMKTSIFMHNNSFKKIVRAKMSFFYNNSVGVILNRFSRDINVLDDLIPYALHDAWDLSLNGIALFFIMVFSNVYLAIPFIIFISIVAWYRNFFIRTARSLETLEGVGKSPVIQHLTCTLNGLSTVRAFRTEEKFINKFNRFQNDHTSIYFTLITSKRWLVYVLDSLKLIFMTGILTILIAFAEDFSGSLVGLITSYLILFLYEFEWLVIKWSNFESYLSSVDRLSKYNSLESEPALESIDKNNKPPSDWPHSGRIVFDDVTMRYFKNENPVLKNLNFIIEAKQKIGIVGRTGAGKSSILAALFRMTEYEGNIMIDGINCKDIGLHELRKKITIIPQIPVLFNGTVRSNLDPLDEYSDYQLWNSLKSVQLEQVVKELEGGLDSKVIDNGGNFSVGQKQLICLARAILKENKILVLDEATANTDPSTDELIQATIRNVFKHCSILTIAHRLNTIMDSTKILVLDAGEVREFDTPYRLLQDNTSLFSSMVDAYGEEQAKNLRKIAKQSASLNN